MKTRIIILAIALILVVGFIWGNSMLSPALSGKISSAVESFLDGIFGGGSDGDTVGGVSVRKLAHFFEFAALGVLACLLFRYLKLQNITQILSAALCGFFFAVSDETIQIFSGRGASVRDVWIDLFGYAAGVFLIGSGICLVRAFKNRGKK